MICMCNPLSDFNTIFDLVRTKWQSTSNVGRAEHLMVIGGVSFTAQFPAVASARSSAEVAAVFEAAHQADVSALQPVSAHAKEHG